MEQQMQQQLQELLDRKSCEDVLMRYGRTLDWLDQKGQEECFWPDAEIDYGFFQGNASDWVPTVMAVESAAARRWHISAGIMVQVEGDRARSECYGLTAASSENEAGELVDTLFGGRYLDEFEKRDGQWRISKRRYIADWTHNFPNGLDALADNGLQLNVLQILQSDHASYRRL